MAFVGYLSKFSLPELFRFIQEGYKSGLLTIRFPNSDDAAKTKTSYIWLQQGRIVAASDNLENQGLLTLIIQRGWMPAGEASKLFQTSPGNMAMGLCLKSQGLLQSEQLNLLFRAQITSHVCPLFQLHDGQFELTSLVPLPNAEMTGISIPATEATIMGLRMLRDWSALTRKLPDLTSGLTKITVKPQIRLEYSESQVFEYATGKISLQDIARTIELPIEKVVQIAFRLIVTNLVEESLLVSAPQSTTEISPFDDLNTANAFGQKTIPIEKPEPLDTKLNSQLNNNNHSQIAVGASKLLEPVSDSSAKAAVSQSFLNSLVGFLQSKATI
jgi:Domain of unknown function (DUF4388)